MRATAAIVLCALLPLGGIAGDDPAGSCELRVVAVGVRGDAGSVGFLVFSSSEGWPRDRERALARQGVPAREGDVEAAFPGVPSGTYAIVITHDENGNKELDRSPSGRPLEGWGMSNDPKARLKTPTFSKAAVEVGCDDRVEIRVWYRKKNG